MKKKMRFFCALLTCFSVALSINAKSNGDSLKHVLQINLRNEVNSVTWMEIKKGLEKAHTAQYDAVIINMNTYGGEVLYADSIRTSILNSSIPVAAYINNNAASAGALIAIACDRIFMKQSATMGASTVVDQTGAAAPDKYQSYMRGIIRATAESAGKDTLVQGTDTVYKWKRDPKIAEAMVDPDIFIAELIDTGKVLTLTASEALQVGYCDSIVNSTDDIVASFSGFSNYKLDVYKLNSWDKIKGQLMGTALRAILIMLIIGGIWFELQAPGIGMPTLVSVVSAIFYFAPLYMDGLAQNWEIIVFVIGFILLFLEVMVFPGFGVAGVSGILCMITGLTAALVDNDLFEFSFSHMEVLVVPLATVSLSIFSAVFLSIWLSKKIGNKGSFLEFAALNTTQSTGSGYLGVPVELAELVGATGIADTILRPSGKVRIQEKLFDAKCTFGFIDKGAQIMVVGFESGQLYVEPVSQTTV